MRSFKDGYDNFIASSSGLGVIHGGQYVTTVVDNISELEKNINNFAGKQTDVNFLKGNVAEFWHSGTHNIDAAVKGVSSRTDVLESTDFGSVDVVSNFGKNFGMKYYKDGASSAKAQASSYFERYMKDKKPGQSFGEFLSERGIQESDVLKHEAIYSGQVRVIPEDQLQEAIKFLEGKIAKEANTRPELVVKYKETLDLLTDKIKSNEGSESIPLTDAESRALAKIAKDGDFKAEDYNLTTEELIEFKYVMEQSLKAGLTAATISMALRVAPKILETIDLLIRNGEVDSEQFRKIGFAALKGGSEGYVRGTVSASITISCMSGHFGHALKNIDPTLVGAMTVIVMNTVQNSFKVAAGKMEQRQLADACMRDLFVTTCSLMAGGFTQGAIPIPVFGYLIGSFVGSLSASFVYNSGSKVFLSFAVDTGCTFFGLVDQNYELPRDVLESIGVNVFDYERFSPTEISISKNSIGKFDFNRAQHEKLEITFLRRGVIGVQKVAYL